MNEHRDTRIGWTASVGLHLLLMLGFLVWKMQIAPFILDFTPMTFAPLADVRSFGPSARAALESGSPMVELPRRPMLDETSPLLQLPDRARPLIEAIIPHERPEAVTPDPTQITRRMLLPSSSKLSGERPSTSPIAVNDDWLAGERSQAVSGKLGGDDMFTISWEGPSRVKLSGTPPEFPKGVDRASLVKLTFDVAPDGSVVFISPATKGVPELEKVSIDALRSWRFNRLDPALSQMNQRGEITFVFRLK